MKSKEEQEEVIDITETRREVSTQTEPLPELKSCGVQVAQLPVPAITRDFANQFPQDASVEVRNDHSYARGEEPLCQLLVRQEREDQSETEETVNEDSSRLVDSTEQVEELCSSQYSETTNPVASQSEHYPSDSEDNHRTSQRKIQLISRAGYFLYTRSNLKNCIVFVQNAVPLQLTCMRFKMRVRSFPYI